MTIFYPTTQIHRTESNEIKFITVGNSMALIDYVGKSNRQCNGMSAIILSTRLLEYLENTARVNIHFNAYIFHFDGI